VVDNNLTAIFAQSWMGGLYIGVEEPFTDEYVQCSDPDCGCGEGGSTNMPTTFYRMLDDIGESDVLRELRRAQEMGEISPQYKVHMPYRWGTGQGITYLMKRDKDGVKYLPGRGLDMIRKRWATKAKELADNTALCTLGLKNAWDAGIRTMYCGRAGETPEQTKQRYDALEGAEYQEYLDDKAARSDKEVQGG